MLTGIKFHFLSSFFHQYQWINVKIDFFSLRERMTDVIVQNLITNEKILLKCRDWIRKVAVYKNRLAVNNCEHNSQRIARLYFSNNILLFLRYCYRQKWSFTS